MVYLIDFETSVISHQLTDPSTRYEIKRRNERGEELRKNFQNRKFFKGLCKP